MLKTKTSQVKKIRARKSITNNNKSGKEIADLKARVKKIASNLPANYIDRVISALTKKQINRKLNNRMFISNVKLQRVADEEITKLLEKINNGKL